MWDCRVIESEEDCTKQYGRLVNGIGLKLGVNIDDESRTDGREQTRLQDQVRGSVKADCKQRTNIKVVLRSSSYFLT